MATKLVREHVTMSAEVAKWFADKAESMGMTQSGLMLMAMATWMDQQKGLAMGNDLQTMLAHVEYMRNEQR